VERAEAEREEAEYEEEWEEAREEGRQAEVGAEVLRVERANEAEVAKSLEMGF
jgi:hypothetical protein